MSARLVHGAWIGAAMVALDPATGAGASNGNVEFRLLADPVRMAVIPDAQEQTVEHGNVRRKEANAIFEVGESLRVGYRGYLDCTSASPTRPLRQTSGR